MVIARRQQPVLSVKATVFEDGPPMWLRPACAYIELNAPITPSVGEVAASVGVSSARLIGGFRYFLGFTPSEFLAELSGRPEST